MAKKKNKKENVKKIGRYLSIAAVILIILGIGFIFTSRSGDHDITMNISTEESISRGVPTEMKVSIDNNTTEPLRDSELAISLSQGLVNLDFQGDESLATINLNNLGEGSITRETVEVLPINEVDSSEEITATLSYSIGSAQFEKSVSKEIIIENNPIDLNIQKPDQILEGSNFDTTISYINNSDFDFSNIILRLEYPNSFNFDSASLEPTSLNNRWSLGALNSNSEGELNVRGAIQSSSGDLNMRAVLMAEFINNEYEIASQETSLKPSQSPLSLDVSLSGSPEAGNNLTYSIRYENKSGVALRDVNINSNLAGEMFDIRSIETEGEVDNLAGSILWDQNSNEDLEILEPGESGAVSFSVDLKENFPIRRLSDKNFSVVVNTTIESPTVPYYVEASRTSASEEIRTKIKGKTTIDAKALYRDANSGIINEGDLPPEVGQTTQFTIHWEIANHSTDIEDVVVEAKLPDGVDWSGQVNSNIDAVPLYDSNSKTVTWEIDEIAATRGVISRPIETIFQVELNPLSQFRGSYHPLLSQTTLKASDLFTGDDVNITDDPLNTSLPDDPTVDSSDGIVE